VHFGIEVLRLVMAVKATPMGVNEKLGVSWQAHQPSRTIHDVSTHGFDRVLVIVIQSHILESV